MTTPNQNDQSLSSGSLYRVEDISTTTLFLIVFSGLFIFFLLLMLIIYAFIGKPEAKSTGPGEEIRKQRAALTAKEDSVLMQYALIDPVKGIYRIPVDSAMVIMLREAASLNPAERK